MERYFCHRCGARFDEPRYQEVDNPDTMQCPHCGSSFIEVDEELNSGDAAVFIAPGLEMNLFDLFRLVVGGVPLQGQFGDYVTDEGMSTVLDRLLREWQGTSRLVGLNEQSIAKLPRTKSECTEQCAICQEVMEGEEAIIMECKHEFHAQCLIPWLRKVASCPVCRKSIPND